MLEIHLTVDTAAFTRDTDLAIDRDVVAPWPLP